MMVEGSGGTWWHFIFIWNESIGVAGRVMHEWPQVTAPALNPAVTRSAWPG